MPMEVIHPPYLPITQISCTEDWLKTERRNQCCDLPVVPSTTMSYLGPGLAAAPVPAAQGSFGWRTRCFPSILHITRQKYALSPDRNS